MYLNFSININIFATSSSKTLQKGNQQKGDWEILRPDPAKEHNCNPVIPYFSFLVTLLYLACPWEVASWKLYACFDRSFS